MDPQRNGLYDLSNGHAIDVQSSYPNYDQCPIPCTEFECLPIVHSFDIDPISIPFNLPDLESNNHDPSSGLRPGGVSFVPTVAAATSSPGCGESSDFSLGLDWSLVLETSSPSGEGVSSDPIMKFISEMLMEENIEDEPYMFDNPASLKATKKSLYDALGEQCPPSVDLDQACFKHESSDISNRSGNGNYHVGDAISATITSTSSGLTMETSESVDAQGVGDFGQQNSYLSQAYLSKDHTYNSNLPPHPKVQTSENNSKLPSHLKVQTSENPLSDVQGLANGLLGASASETVQNLFSNSESMLLFKKGLEEASKFLPSASQLVIDAGYSVSLASGIKEEDSNVEVEEEILGRGISPSGLKSGKTHGREDLDVEEGRSNKQSAISVEEKVCEKDLSDLFDKVLLFTGSPCSEPASNGQCGVSKNSSSDEQSNGQKGVKVQAKSRGKKDSVDLTALLILCAQAMSANDFRTASELITQIRQHSSPYGDGSQRLAHYFANGLEARLAGSRNEVQTFYDSLTTKKTSASDLLKAFQTLVNACPFQRASMVFANKVIYHAAEKATTLHIVDFGVLCGYQWPILIQFLSSRPGGPPKLRITGIELPQHGFRPAERLEETGRRLAKYCKKFNVPFEYHPIAKRNWENIRVEDFKIKNNEFVAVNCLNRFRNLFDAMGEEECPRDTVLKLIRKMNPDIFVHSEVNGSYNSPFFLMRFREALFHFSSIYDMLDCTLPREDPERFIIEAESCGRDAINAIACEGLDRVERPETYKQWQTRITKAGFKQLPLDEKFVEMFRKKLEIYHHKDFVIDQDGQWMLQGWKGRIVFASTSWVPS